MIRYEIEKDLFAGQIEVKDIPSIWNAKVKEYLGLDVPDDSAGVLQDIHWATGMFGYFPTYALGSAYAAQIFRTMNKDFKVLKSLKNKNTEEINLWLKTTYIATGLPWNLKSCLKRWRAVISNQNTTCDILSANTQKYINLKNNNKRPQKAVFCSASINIG